MRRFAMTRLRELPVRLALVAGLLLGARTAAIAQSTVPDDYVVFGDEKVTFGSRATVSDGDIGSNGAVVLGRATSVVPSTTIAADTVRLASDVAVPGHAFYNTLRVASSAQIGTRHLGVAIPIFPLPPLPPNPVAGPSLVVTTSMTATPGSYGSIDVLPGGQPRLGTRKLQRRHLAASGQRQGSDDAVVPGHGRRLHHLRRGAGVARREQHRRSPAGGSPSRTWDRGR